MIARSLRSSSEFGALSHSTKLAVGNSRPMTGVESNDSYPSRAPDSLKGCGSSVNTDLEPEGEPRGASIADGAMLKYHVLR